MKSSVFVSVALAMLVGLSGCGGGSSGGGTDTASPPVAPQPEPPAPPPSFTPLSQTDVVFSSALVDGGNRTRDLLLDVYQSGEVCDAPRPFTIMTHGGGFTSGNKSTGVWRDIGEGLAERNIVGIAITYRLFDDDPEPSPEFDQLAAMILAGRPELTNPTADELQLLDTIVSAVEDARSAVQWAQANADDLCLDPDRFALWGSSAGANTSLLLGYAIDDAGLDPVGQTVLVDYWGSQMVEGAMQSGESPLFILHGSLDETVLYSEALDLQAEAEANGIPYTFYTVEGARHGFGANGVTTNGVDGKTFLELSLDFVEAHLYDGAPVYEVRTVPAEEQATDSYGQNFDTAPLGIISESTLDTLFANPVGVRGVAEGRAAIIDGQDAFEGRALAINLEAPGLGADDSGVEWVTNFPATVDEFYLSYRLRFSPGFDFLAGGSLPGLAGGTDSGFPNGFDRWSANLVWTSGGEVAQRLEHPDQSAQTGDILLWDDGIAGQRRFEAGIWYTVEHRVLMNTPGQADGLIEASFNGELALRQEGLNFRDTANLAIDQLRFSVFYGGGALTLQPGNDGQIVIDDIILSTRPILQE